MLIVTPCRSDMSAAGLSRYAHLADGRLHLALVRACSVPQYLQFLALIPRMGALPKLARSSPSAEVVALRAGRHPQARIGNRQFACCT